MSIRFGVSPIAWVNDDMPTLGAGTTLDQILREAHEIGFTGVELGGIFPREAATLQAALAPHQLELVGGWYSGNLLVQDADAEIAALQPHLDLLKAMGSQVFVFAETSNATHCVRSAALDTPPRLQRAAWDRFGNRLNDVAQYIGAEGLRFAYHHHLGTVVETTEDLALLVAHTTDAVGLTLDTGHAALGGIETVDIIARHPRRIAHVHCKDVRTDVHQHIKTSGQSFLDGVLAGMFTAPGDGSVDFGAVMGALKRIDYSGWIIVEAEQDPALANPITYSTLGFHTVHNAAAAAKLI